MIHFSCSCGMKFKVKPAFAGRATKCPTCKQALTVPAFDQTVAHAPEGQIDGTPSSLAHAGLDGGVTLAQEAGLHELLTRQTTKGQRYVIDKEIARGGMGAVLRAVDCDIRREVAVKYMLGEADSKRKVRFVEEAQITGQLEHPNIVPIHELGVDPQKRVFFSMKMVKGRSLQQILEELRQNPKKSVYSQGRLLNILVNVCNGLAYAHSRGVIHRDLKPANVMVGDFGEVYVMDWGLAKVLKGGPVTNAPVAALVQDPTVATTAAIPVARSTKVETSREPEADLTQEGSVLGTPAYMPPEQAIGDHHAVDARSDVYSLGAILYEMLVLHPPFEKSGDYLAVLARVVQGQIVAPELRNPARARQIPRELSAIAMKALAKNPRDRYQDVEALRRDVERFQEGRSVSAKQDTLRELLWKVVKRNKAVSAALFVLLPVLVVVVGFAFKHYLAYKKGEAELTLRTRRAVPALTMAARQVANAGKVPEALEQIDLALLYEPKDVDAHLLRGQLLVASKEWFAGRKDLEQYLQERPGDVDARKLLDLCTTGRPDDAAVLWDVADVLQRQNVPGLAIPLVEEVQVTVKARQPQWQLYRNQVNTNWKGLGDRVGLERNGQLSLNFFNCKQVVNLGPLKGMRFHSVNLSGCPVKDLTPLKGMPLTSLDLGSCVEVKDVTPLQGMPLTFLNLNWCAVEDLAPLRGMPLTSLSVGGCPIRDLGPLQGMKLVSLNIGNCGQVGDLAPLKGMPLTALYLAGSGLVRDLGPLQGMKLTSLNLHAFGLVEDLAPLEGMALTTLHLTWCAHVKDLTPLRHMPLTTLSLYGCGQVTDLAPLKGLRLTYLDLRGCSARDLTPLQGLDLTEIQLPPTIPKGMDVLRRMPSLLKINDLSAKDFWKKHDTRAS